MHGTDLKSASDDKDEIRKLKHMASRSFSGGVFTQSKCYSNLKDFDGDTKQVKKTLEENICLTFAKVHAWATNNNTKIFTVAQNKQDSEIDVTFLSCKEPKEISKSGVMKVLASI